MSDNDRIVLNTVLEQNRKELAPDQSINEYFEIFAAEQVLKQYDLSYEEIIEGRVGAGGDGGIDSIHLFVNGSLIQEDTETGTDNFGKKLIIELHIVQAKLENGFNETTIQKFDSSFKDLFDLSKDIDDLGKVYNSSLIGVIEKFREIFTNNAHKLPELYINSSYVSIGDEVHPNVKRLVGTLKTTVIGLFSSAIFNFQLLAADLLSIMRKTPVTVYNLKLAENPISSGDNSFVCLVNLIEYYTFICDSERHLKRHLFEANVRDYQGSVQVNQGIQETLEVPKNNDFWWLNNGITMIASRASLSGKTITIENPMIVNGMQTSYEIYKHYSKHENPIDNRNLLVRVIGIAETPEEFDTRNKVIKATNSQTAIQVASLRATDDIQLDIEAYLKSQGYYYDRRKNYYKNERKPYKKIISITYLAQSIIGIVLRRPNDARARPSTLLRDQAEYSTIFNPEYPVVLYLKCIQIVKHIEEYLKSRIPGINSTDVANYKFHLAMFAALLSSNKPQASAAEVATIDITNISSELLDVCYNEVKKIYESSRLGTYYASKSKDVVKKLNKRLEDLTYIDHK
jgi:hypothetical protein